MSATAPIMDLAVPALVWLLMLAVGLDLTPADLGRVLRYPRTVALATLGQLVALPVLAAILIWTLTRDQPRLPGSCCWPRARAAHSPTPTAVASVRPSGFRRGAGGSARSSTDGS
ncbi:hypothetical protein [uncultured Thiodictyon sp.]|uniref:hypothetical protein n=2 Tax=uncultured Thiodictyon sp. TaxID=1846217 RepID=UPI00345773B4